MWAGKGCDHGDCKDKDPSGGWLFQQKEGCHLQVISDELHPASPSIEQDPSFLAIVSQRLPPPLKSRIGPLGWRFPWNYGSSYAPSTHFHELTHWELPGLGGNAQIHLQSTPFSDTQSEDIAVLTQKTLPPGTKPGFYTAFSLQYMPASILAKSISIFSFYTQTHASILLATSPSGWHRKRVWINRTYCSLLYRLHLPIHWFLLFLSSQTCAKHGCQQFKVNTGRKKLEKHLQQTEPASKKMTAVGKSLAPWVHGGTWIHTFRRQESKSLLWSASQNILGAC